MRTILLKILNILFPPEKPSDSDRLNYYADQRCKTCPYRLAYMKSEEPMIESTLTKEEKHALHLEYVRRHSPVGRQYEVSTAETQLIPVEAVRRVTRMLDQQEYARRMQQAEQEMMRHGSETP